MNKIGIVVLNYKNYKDTIECVNSLLAQKDVEMEIVVVDNGSGNESADELRRVFAQIPYVELRVIKNNLGYAKGNNVGIQYLRQQGIEYIMVLNSDTMLKEEDTLKTLMEGYEKQAGILVPLVRNLDGTIEQRVAYKANLIYLRIIKATILRMFPRKTSKVQGQGNVTGPNERLTGLQRENYVVAGSAFVLTPDFFANYEQLFPKTFLYFEEWATILYLKKAGLYSKIVETAEITHKGAASTPEDLKAGMSRKQKMMAQSARHILKLVFTPRRWIQKFYS